MLEKYDFDVWVTSDFVIPLKRSELASTESKNQIRLVTIMTNALKTAQYLHIAIETITAMVHKS